MSGCSDSRRGINFTRTHHYVNVIDKPVFGISSRLGKQYSPQLSPFEPGNLQLQLILHSSSKNTYVMLSNKMHSLNQCFNSILLLFDMFRTSYVHHQEDYIGHAALYVAGHVARMGEERGYIGSWWGNRREGDHWGDLGVDGWIILGWISRRWDVGIWTGLGWPRIETGGGRF